MTKRYIPKTDRTTAPHRKKDFWEKMEEFQPRKEHFFKRFKALKITKKEFAKLTGYSMNTVYRLFEKYDYPIPDKVFEKINEIEVKNDKR